MHTTEISSEELSIIKSFKESEDLFDFKNRFGSTDAENLVEALWLCSGIVMTCKRKLKHDIIVITNNDEPYPVHSAEVDKCQERQNDLRDLDVIVEIVPMVDDEFDVNKFWREFICSVNDYDVGITTHVIETTDEKTNTTTLRRLLPGDQRKVLEVVGQKIILTPVEVTKLKSFGMP
ncbi:hypothetical protein HA402_009382 [Bradysia odoriphaga]|nr:hypothetical protein HA402_009382 [Bradysia odoriphaga]